MAKTAETQEQKTTEEQVATTTSNEEALENFQWDDTGEGDFFGIADTAVPKEEVEEVIEKVKKTATTKEEEEVEVEENEEENFFGIKEDKETGEPVVVEENEEELEINDYRSHLLKMKENGILQNIEIPEEGEITDDKFIEFQDLEVESRVDEAFKGFFSELDDDGAAFLQHKKDGGSTEDFFKAYGQNVGAPKGDLDDENYQEKVSRYYYANVEGEDAEDIDDKIEWLKDSGKLEKYAQKFDTKIKETEKEAKKNLAKATREAEEAAETSRQAFVDSVQETLDSTDKVDNFTFTKESKKTLLPFITKPSVKVGPNKYITPMQSRLSTALKTPEKMLILAQLLENDFDVSTIVANAQTVQAKKIKKNVQRQKSVRPTSSGKTGDRKNLSDYF